MGTPICWMVYKGNSESEMDDLGVPPFMETPIWGVYPISRRPGAVDDRAGSKELGSAHHGLLERKKECDFFTMKNVELTNHGDVTNSH